jgi:hypothetical protein
VGTASFAQNSFLGGEWSKQMQGRFDLPDYRTGMNECLNLIPIEEGACPRRSGTRLGGVTRNGAYGVLREYNVDEAQPYDIELTAGFLRLWPDSNLVTHPGIAVSDISVANPAVFTSVAHGLDTGDQVLFTLASATTYAGIDQVLGRQLSVTVLDTDTFTVVDALTGAVIDGTLIDFTALVELSVFKIFELTTNYSEDDLQQIRIVQDGVDALLLHRNYPPQIFAIQTNTAGAFSNATIADAAFNDGPYLDIPEDGTTLTPSATSGSITFTASAITSINDGRGFLATDVGRMFRVFSEPPDWVPDTYAAGEKVKDAGTYWRAVGNGANSPTLQPSTNSGRDWVIDPTAAAWTWGTITSISSSTSFVGTLAPEVTYPDNTAGGNLLYTNAIKAWQLGAYSDTTLYPSVGAYFQGRVWLGGAAKNRFDACVSNDFAVNGYINFAPTGLDGTVADNNGISGTLNAREIENFLWMLPDEQGILAGTQSGEWIIASSGSGEPITPTSILTREMTHYGSLNATALKIERATVFIHRDTRKIYEYMANYFTQKFVADNLTLKAKHLTVGGVAEVAYMRELTPIIWARLENGGLIGCTYKHDDPIKPLEFAAWHRHQLGTERNVISIQGGPANGGQTDTLSMVTQDPDTLFCYVEFLQTLWDDGDDLLTAWYLDGALKAAAAEKIGDIIRVYGLWYMVGETVTVWAAGVDCGDFTISADGTIDLPLGVGTSLFTVGRLEEVTALGCTSLSTDIVASDPSPTVYIMEAKENYDTNRIDQLDDLTTYTNTIMTTDQRYQGVQWDPVRRNLMYMYTENLPSTPRTNTTGHGIWDGSTFIGSGGAVDPLNMFNTYVCSKNIDTEQVLFYRNYNENNTVPVGIGGGNGTWRRYTRDFLASGYLNNGNGPGMTDPYTGNYWVFSESCELYCFRLGDDYSQVISPLFPVGGSSNVVEPVGFTNTGATSPWTFAKEISPGDAAYLYLVPRLLTATEISADYLLAYATFTYPTSLPAISDLYNYYNREVLDHSGNMYLFSCNQSGGKSFALHKFSPPTSAPYGGPTVGGGFTDITPWGVSTGPNGDASGYTLARSAFGEMETGDIIPMYLPGTDDLVLISKFFPAEHTAGSTDPALMKWSVTYVHAPDGTPTFDHHSAFVTGYMTAAWAPSDLSSADYAVYDAFEVNNYLGQSDYDYTADVTGLDYTRRWFFFLCKRVTGGTLDNSPRIVLVEYSFVYGSAPTVVQVIDEQGWDDAYPDYAPRINDVYEPHTPASTPAVAVSMSTLYNINTNGQFTARWDKGIYDPVTNSFWWSGGATNSSGTLVPFCQFNSDFANRMQRSDGTPGGSAPAATPPFLKLSFGQGYCAPLLIGHTYCSRGQILRAVNAQESMTQTGPSLGKLRRTTEAMPLLFDTQGMSMGVDFLQMRPLAFKSEGGTVPLTLLQTFSGVYKGQVDATDNYDNMWCWEVCRPYPCTVVAVELQHKANENT